MEPSNTSTGTGEAARGVMDKVRDTATAQLSTQKARATDGLGSLAQAVRQSTQPFRDNQQDTIAQYIEKAADGLERFSARLRDRDMNDLMQDAQQFARRQPALFIGAAFAVGVIAARFLKSSSEPSGHGLRSQYEASSRIPRSTAPYGSTSSQPRFAGGGL